MMKHGFFGFHIVDESPWPIYMSFGLFSTMLSILEFVNFMDLGPLTYFSLLFVLSSFYGWSQDIINEGTHEGMHTTLVQSGLKLGFTLFIISEIMFFISFFWSLFYYSLTPSVNLGGWPPVGVSSVNPIGIPLLGSMILISSGVSVTWSHQNALAGDCEECMSALGITAMLGMLFTAIQLGEYSECYFTASDSVYGSIFFMMTGFHGMHVIVGTVFLSVCWVRLLVDHFSTSHHLGLEFAIWYWHFVDVVWLFLYVCMYLWGW